MYSRKFAMGSALGSVILACAMLSIASAAHGGGHGGGGGGGAHGGAMHGGGGFHGSAAHGVAVRPGGAHASAGHIYANGTAHYGYGYYGHYHGYYGGYPYWGWGWGYPYWSVGFYWGWPYYGYGYPYGYPYYGPPAQGGGDYNYGSDEEAAPTSGPATIVTGVSPSRAEIVLDGENVGTAKDYNGRWDRLTVSPGHHTLSFNLAGYRSLSVDIDARPGRTYTFNDVLTAGSGEDHRAIADPAPAQAQAQADAKGRLKLNVTPLDAAVYLDGEYFGVAGEFSQMHGAVSIPAGTHHLEVVRPGYVTVKTTVDVGTSDVAKADVTLEREH